MRARMSYLADVFRSVRRSAPTGELDHSVGFWNRKGLKMASSVEGLAYLLAPGAPRHDCRLRADGIEVPGDQIAAWAEQHIPQALAIARQKRGVSNVTPAGVSEGSEG